VLLPEHPLAPGARELALSARLPGQDPVAGDRVAVVNVPQRGATAAAAQQQGNAAAASPGTSARTPRDRARAVQVPREGGGRPLLPGDAGQGPGAARGTGPGGGSGSGSRGPLALGTLDYSEHGDVSIAGTARPGAHVEAYLDNRPVGGADADAQGG